MTNDSGRRTVLKWISSVLATGVASIVGVPAVTSTIGSLRRQVTPQAKFRRVARLADLPADRPVMIPVIGDVQDAWTLHPNESIGRVWLMRGELDDADLARTPVRALSAVCPHLGCTVQMAADSTHFACPCHKADFAFDGQRRVDPQASRPNASPRSMDPLQIQIVQDEASQQWWIEVKYEDFQQGLTTSTPLA